MVEADGAGVDADVEGMEVEEAGTGVLAVDDSEAVMTGIGAGPGRETLVDSVAVAVAGAVAKPESVACCSCAASISISFASPAAEEEAAAEPPRAVPPRPRPRLRPREAAFGGIGKPSLGSCEKLGVPCN